MVETVSSIFSMVRHYATGTQDTEPITGRPDGRARVPGHTIRQPGTYAHLSHNLIEAFAYDAKAILVAEGEWNDDLMEQVKPPGNIQ